MLNKIINPLITIYDKIIIKKNECKSTESNNKILILIIKYITCIVILAIIFNFGKNFLKITNKKKVFPAKKNTNIYGDNNIIGDKNYSV